MALCVAPFLFICEYWSMILCVFMLMKKSNFNIQLIIFSRECLEGNIQTYDVWFFPLIQRPTFFCAVNLWKVDLKRNRFLFVVHVAQLIGTNNLYFTEILQDWNQVEINFTCLGLPKLCTANHFPFVESWLIFDDHADEKCWSLLAFFANCRVFQKVPRLEPNFSKMQLTPKLLHCALLVTCKPTFVPLTLYMNLVRPNLNVWL